MPNSITVIPQAWDSGTKSESVSTTTHNERTAIQKIEQDIERIDLILTFMNKFAADSKQLILAMLLAKLKTQIILTILNNIPNDSIALALVKGLKDLIKKLSMMQSGESIVFDADNKITPEYLNSILRDSVSKTLTNRELDEIEQAITQSKELQQALKYWLNDLSASMVIGPQNSY